MQGIDTPRTRGNDDTPRRLGVLLFVVYVLTANYRFEHVDSGSAAVPAYQLATHGNVWMDQFARLPLWWVSTGDGHLVSNRFPGASLFATPFYLLFRPLLPSFTYLPSKFAAASAAAISVVLLYLLVREWVGRRGALAAALVVGLATPTWTVSADALWTHGVGQLVLLGALLAVVRQRWAVAAGLLGAAVLVRPHYVMVGLAFVVCYAIVNRRPRVPLVLSVGVATGISALLAYNVAVFGTLSISNGYATSGLGLPARDPVDLFTNIAGAFVSPSRGAFLFSPFIVVLLPGLVAGWRMAPTWARVAAIGGVAYLVTQLALIRFSGGYGFFPYRTPIESITLCGPLLISAFRESIVTTRRRWLFVAALAWSAGVSVIAGALTIPPRTGRDPDWWRSSELLTFVRDAPAATAVAFVFGVAAVLTAYWLITRAPPHAPTTPPTTVSVGAES